VLQVLSICSVPQTLKAEESFSTYIVHTFKQERMTHGHRTKVFPKFAGTLTLERAFPAEVLV
jgi:hypothetical protein